MFGVHPTLGAARGAVPTGGYCMASEDETKLTRFPGDVLCVSLECVRVPLARAGTKRGDTNAGRRARVSEKRGVPTREWTSDSIFQPQINMLQRLATLNHSSILVSTHVLPQRRDVVEVLRARVAGDGSGFVPDTNKRKCQSCVGTQSAILETHAYLMAS